MNHNSHPSRPRGLFSFVAGGILLLTLFATGCSRSDSHAGHDHGDSHTHTAPNGGVIVELGDHQFNLELLLDRATGELVVFVLDDHAEDAVRVEWPALTLRFTAPVERELTLTATANTLSGETVGDTSELFGQADWLKTDAPLRGMLPALTLKGVAFGPLPFELPADTGTTASAHDHAH